MLPVTLEWRVGRRVDVATRVEYAEDERWRYAVGERERDARYVICYVVENDVARRR